MDYRAALNYILSFSDYERWPGAGYAERWDLRRMEDILLRLGQPHLEQRTVHVAGSKGKGSTAAMIASALVDAGSRTGLYISPHLHTMRERIRVNGQFITEEEFAELTSEMKCKIAETCSGPYGELSTFEILTALAFCHFKKQTVDFQVLETGLGGRLDATNVTTPEVCVITSISMDHTAVLGDTIAQIAREKAGIIKNGVPVVSSPQVPEAEAIIQSICSERRARLIVIGREVAWRGKGLQLGKQLLEVDGLRGSYDLAIPLLGDPQLENAATAVAALEVLEIEHANITAGLSNVHWSGRFEVLGNEPLFIADGAHNSDSARKLVDSLKQYTQFDRTILIIGTSADKNSPGIVAELASFFDNVITTTSEHPRATHSADLTAAFAQYGSATQTTRNIPEAVSKALELAGNRDLICATGSLFLVAEVIEYVTGIIGERYPTFNVPSMKYRDRPLHNHEK